MRSDLPEDQSASRPAVTRRPLASLAVRGLLVVLVVIIGLFIAWDYRATTDTHIHEKKAALEDEATMLLTAIGELRDQSPERIQKFIDDTSASMSETTSPGHHIALVAPFGTLQDTTHHNDSPEMLEAMKRGAARPDGIAVLDGGNIIVGWESTPDDKTTLYVSEYMSNVYLYGRQEVTRRIVSAVVLGIVLAAVLNILLYRRITRPLRAMAHTVRSFSSGDFSRRMPDPGTAELGLLADEFDNMAAALQKATDEQSRLTAALDARNKDLARFLYITSHDLKAPIANIEGFGTELAVSLSQAAAGLDSAKSLDDLKRAIETLLRTDMPESVEFIRASAAKLHSLIEGLLQLSRLGHTELKPVTLDMTSMVRDIIKTIQFQITSVGAETQVDELPACRGDADQLNRLFSNLIGNAVKYLDPARAGRIRISGRVERGRCVYSVADNGVGIPPAEQEKVFEIFHRVDSSSHISGEGLGLAIAKRIVERHDGAIRLESTPGAGTTFFVELPAA